MFLKVFSAHLRGSASICNAFRGNSGHIVPGSRIALLRIIESTSRCTSSSYSTKQTGSSSPKDDKKPSGQNALLSQEEIRVLNQNPDSFGTLVSFEPLEHEKIPDKLQPEGSDSKNNDIKEQTITEDQKPSKRDLAQQYEIQLKSLIEEGNISEAVEVFESQMLRKGKVLAKLRIYNWLIDECLKWNHFARAFDVYELMVNRGLKVPFDIIEKLLIAYERTDVNIKKIYSIQKIMSKYQYEPNELIYNVLIRAIARSSQWQVAFDLADEMMERGFVYELATIDVMLETCYKDTNNGFCRLIELWHEMRGLNYTPSVSSFSAFLKGVEHCELSNIAKLKETLDSITSKCKRVQSSESDEAENMNLDLIDDGRPNLLANPPKIGHLLPLNQVKRPEDRLLILGGLTGILKEMRQHRIKPNYDTIIGLLNVTPNSFAAQQKVISLLNKNEVPPDVDLFNALLTKCCLRRNFTDSKEIIDMMHSADIDVDLVSHGLLAMSCKTKTDAEEFFVETRHENASWDTDIFDAMMKNACTTKDNELIIYLLRKMKTNQIEPSYETLQMINEYQEKQFRALRTIPNVDKRTKNECFKLLRECKQWKKHFQNDEPKKPFPEDQTKPLTEAKTPKSNAAAKKTTVKTSSA